MQPDIIVGSFVWKLRINFTFAPQMYREVNERRVTPTDKVRPRSYLGCARREQGVSRPGARAGRGRQGVDVTVVHVPRVVVAIRLHHHHRRARRTAANTEVRIVDGRVVRCLVRWRVRPEVRSVVRSSLNCQRGQKSGQHQSGQLSGSISDFSRDWLAVRSAVTSGQVRSGQQVQTGHFTGLLAHERCKYVRALKIPLIC